MDPEIQKNFKTALEEFFTDLNEDEAVVFMDGMHPYDNSGIGKAWIKVGKEKQIISNSG